MQFAPSSGHWCVCQRPLGGAQRPRLLRFFDRLNDNNVVLRCPLHYSELCKKVQIIANALGVNACQSGYKTRYIRLPELFSELEAARIQGKYHQVMKQFQKLPLVILDEFLLIPASEQE